MRDVVIVDAVRTPVGRRNGGMSTCHSVDVLGTVQKALFDRTGIDPLEVGQVVGGCVGQVGMQSMNVTRTAWLTAGLPLEVPATTITRHCGDAPQAATFPATGIMSALPALVVACGLPVTTMIPIGLALAAARPFGPNTPLPR